MKLNEKGFAFSTMLYGSIALIAIVLYVILNINKTASDTTYYFGEELVDSLNECVTEEIALENCYSSGNSNCNTSSYYACLGISDNNSIGVIMSEYLKYGPVGYAEDEYENNRYIFKGNDANNYLSYSGKLWRIISIEPGGYLKLLDISKYATKEWDEAGYRGWGTNSTLFDNLNINYLSTITDSSKLYQNSWYASVLYPSLHSNYAIRDLLEQEKDVSNEEIISAKVGLLSVSDYLKATTNSNCKTDIFGSNFKNCNSWLSQYKSWTIDINGELGMNVDGYAYYFGMGQNGNNNTILYQSTNEVYDIYPVIYLDRNSIYKSGVGTELDPFTLK